MSGISSKALMFGEPINKEKTFQGQRFDDELGLDWVQFKWRNHDPQIGRFIELDPLSEEYEYNSPYSFSENKVIAHVELEGLESVQINEETPHSAQEKLYKEAVKKSVKDQKNWSDNTDRVSKTFALTKGSDVDMSIKTKIATFGAEASVCNDEYDIIAVRDNKKFIGGTEVGTGEKVSRTGDSFGVSAGPVKAGFGEITETRTGPGNILMSQTKTNSIKGTNLESTMVYDNKGTLVQNTISLELFGVKLAAGGLGVEVQLKINFNPQNSGITPPLPKFGNAAVSTGVKAPFNPTLLPKKSQ